MSIERQLFSPARPSLPTPRTRRIVASLAALALVVALSLGLSTAPAQAADTATATISNARITGASTTITPDGFLAAANAPAIQNWNPGTTQDEAAGHYVRIAFDLAIANGAVGGQTFSLELPPHWRVRNPDTVEPLRDTAGNVLATVTVTSTNGTPNDTLLFTLAPYVDGRVDIVGSYEFQAQEWRSPSRTPGDYVGTIVTGNDVPVLELRQRVPAERWTSPGVTMGWTGNATTPTGIVDARSRGSWNGQSPVTMTVFAGAGYDFDCDSLRNQDPTQPYGIGLVDIGAAPASAPTSEWLLDPSLYTLSCDAGSFTIHMPASSWTSADATTGQVLRAFVHRVGNGDQSWLPEQAVFAYLSLTQDGTTQTFQGRSPQPGASGAASSNLPAPGAFQTLMFQDVNGNDLYDEGVDGVLPGIDVQITGTTGTGEAVDMTITTEASGIAHATLRPGSYVATILTPPTGMQPVAANAGNDAIDSDFVDGTVSFTIASLQTVERDAGFFVPMATFEVVKHVTGTGSGAVPTDTPFVVEYEYPAGIAFPAGSGELTVFADGVAVPSDPIPVGAVVTLVEQPAEPVPGTEWVSSTFVPTTVTVGEGEPVRVTLTNEIDLLLGTFEITKVITGTGAGLVPDDTVFTVAYSYPAGPGYEAGGGTIEVSADGTTAVSDPIPAGAVVTLREDTPAEIAGMTWTDAALSTNVVEIVAGESVAVTLTNEATTNPAPTPSATPSAPPTSGPSLPGTGLDGGVVLALLLSAGVALAAGALLTRARRR